MHENSMISCILTRRSIRKYQVKEISDSEIKTILEAAMQAPSAVNKQPWHFIVSKNKTIFKNITKIHQHAGFIENASHGILVCGDEKLEHDKGYSILDCSAATENILLAANALGIGACWIGIHPRENRKKAFSKLFGLPDHIQPISLISLGYPSEEKGFVSRYSEDKIHYNHWIKE